jgi:uncharacterized protein YodC (DUF2158 family)
MSDIQPGDVVMCKAGGPKMTVSKLGMMDNAYCTWFENKASEHEPPVWGDLKREWFDLNQLVKVS